ncbi:uncharacterized protein OCT59_000566 [Rhizophagus irregularis]|uniref:uncharacterized protein n=1 Tax=Rhizophagus irregularis TaxID=588596 RepID=UPI0019D8B51F|nr:hypothetical protein OCT59_000566 [Rhizophagus irregularis]GET66648.1 hypothetical protein GLOIN_2v928369 [Rhizophagus irregularis DAOM 181602=DAOM 197198]
MFCDSYFNDTPPSDWSYLSFLETLKPVFMSTDQDVSLSENSALRKRYRNVLKRIVSEKRDNEQVKVATSLLQKDETHGIKEFWENINLDKKWQENGCVLLFLTFDYILVNLLSP